MTATMSEQQSAMRDRWPGFRCIILSDGGMRWAGELRPLSQSYAVSIRFGPPLPSALEMHIHLTVTGGVPKGDMHRMFPVVQVVRPQLHVPQARSAISGFPHVYRNPRNAAASPLCLFDPRRGEWTYSDLIAHTTVPWTADWLCCYEGWLATGHWLGGGSHVGEGPGHDY